VNRIELIVRSEPEVQGHRRWIVASPAPGWFRPTATISCWLAPGDTLGTLDVLGRHVALVVPLGTSGHVANVLLTVDPPSSSFEPRAVGYGDVLALLDTLGGVAGSDVDPPHATAAHGLVFRAPTSGRYYGRPAPDKPAFVDKGSELQPGSTICLLEVMKTFNRVSYSGVPVRVREVLVAEGADVNAGDALLALEAI
jgi:acetyl-CoA carboxylase biotin carboxyl carrier protein